MKHGSQNSVEYEELHILYNNNTIKKQARSTIESTGSNPDHANDQPAMSVIQ